MQIINLYKYIREDGGTTVSPNKPECEYTEMYRIIADEGKTLINGDVMTSCADVESFDGWEEIDDPEAFIAEYERILVEPAEEIDDGGEQL
jgi:hypothetical protein